MSQLLSNLEIGSKVKFGKYQVESEEAQDIVWTIVAKNHVSEPAYPDNPVTLHASEILDLRCFDAKEPNNSDSERQEYGNNRYAVSNMNNWLNSRAAADSWYSAQHSADQSPDSSTYVYAGTQHASRPGFLNLFSDNEYNAILNTTIRTAKPTLDGSDYEDISIKVFLPSVTEIFSSVSGMENITEGNYWGYYTSSSDRISYLTQQCYDNTMSNSKPSSKETGWYWWLRTPRYDDPNDVWSVKSDGSGLYGYYPWRGQIGVRPALNLSTSLLVSNNTDSDGCYTFVWATTAPDSIIVPELNAGASAYVSWSEVQNAAGYILERSVDKSSFTEVYRGSDTVYADTILTSWSTVQYRVSAYDADGNTSDYTISGVANVNKISTDLLSAIRNHTEQNIKITFDDGTVLGKRNISVSSGGLTLTEVLNGETDMTVGRAVSSQAEMVLFNTDGEFQDFNFNQEFTLQIGVKINGEFEYITLGIFKGERPEKVRGKLINFSAYDRMVYFDISAEDFIAGLTFPTTLGEIYQKLCDFVGVNPVSLTFINSDKQFTFNPFSNAEYTAREILAWIAEAAGSYARINPSGNVELTWFTNKSHTILKSDRFEMTESEFTAPAIDKLEVYNSYGDQLVTAGEGSNTYVISDNPFLYIENDTEIEGLQTFVNQLYNRLITFPTYNPASLRAEWYPEIKCGNIINVVDDYGNNITFPIFSQTITWKGFGRVEYENSGGLIREIAPIQQRELEGLKKNMLKTTDLYTSISSYLNSQEGKASITSAVGGEFVQISDGSSLTSTNEIAQLIENTETGINNKISLTAGIGKGTIGSNVQAMLTLFANTDTSSISLAANAITLTATPQSTEEEYDVGDQYHLTGQTYYFEKTSDGYYTSNNAGVNSSYAYGILKFSFTEQTLVKLYCISYGESNYDYGIVSTLDNALSNDNTADTSNVLKSFKGESSESPQTLTITVPEGSHYITFKYIKDTSAHSGGDYFKIKATATRTVQGRDTILSLSSNGLLISSTDLKLTGTVTFSDLSTAGATVINGANITTNTLKVKNIYFNSDDDEPILTSVFKTDYKTIDFGVQSHTSASDTNEVNIYGDEINFYYVNSKNENELTMTFDVRNGKILFDGTYGIIGSSTNYLNRLYVKKIYFADGTTMDTAP